VIPDSVVEAVRERADILEIVAERTRLKRSGKTFRGPCPLHGGEGPNFSVDPGKGIFKCFVCGEGGDVFSFLMKQEGLSFLEAVRSLAERVGVEIPERDERQAQVDPNDRYYEANAFAAEWFRRQLRDGGTGAEARAYLTRRGITPEAVERFGLGWAPAAWGQLRDAARAHGIPDELLLSLGLVKEPRTGRDPYDAFRGRLVFPIEDAAGRVIAFGGRVIGEVEEHVPKYLNSPETPVYHKGDVLYGLRWSRGAIRKAEVALVVEGYMDYVSLASHGVDNVVAPLGTALTAEQAALIGRYASRVVLLYDSDSAGLKATFRSGDELLRAGVEVQVATLPEGEDPDSLVRRGGAKELQRYLRDAVDILERKIQILERRDYFGSISGTRRAVDALLPTVRAAADEVLRGVYVARIAERTGVAREIIEREAAEAPREESRPARPARPAPRPQETRREAERQSTAAALRGLGAESNIVLLMLQFPDWIDRVVERLGPEDFRDPVLQEIFRELLQLHAEGEARPTAELLEHFSERLVPRVQELLNDPEPRSMDSSERFMEDSLLDIQSRNLENRLAELGRAIDSAPEEDRTRLLKQQLELRREIQRSGMVVDVNKVRRPVPDS
jgi:DNA primase